MMNRLALLLFSLCCLVLPAHAASDDPVGMVLDLRGDAAPLQLLGYVKAGQQIRLGAQATASVSHYGSKLVYQLTGPLLAQVEPNGIRVVKGAPAQTRSLAEKLVRAAVDPRLSPAAVKMRALSDVTLVTPLNRAVLFGARPRFAWMAEGGSYRVQVDELDGKRIASGSSASGSWELPDDVALAPGTGYRWTVTHADPDGEQASATFTVATSAEREAVVALRPAPDAAIEDWVLYAAILDGRRFDEEARDAWRAIAARRSDLLPPARPR